MSITVFGEALIDMIGQTDGSFRPFPGGSPFNVAKALSNQQINTRYLTPLSDDDFGWQLAASLEDAGVELSYPKRSVRPTSVAVVSVDTCGQPGYSFYREGVADRDYYAETIIQQLSSDDLIFHTGSLALVPEEIPAMAEIFEYLKQKGVLISIDINMRPGVVEDVDQYRRGVKALISYCDILKASDEDLNILGVKGQVPDIISNLISVMDGGIVALTFGASGAVISNENFSVGQDSFCVDHVIDTVGAGDCFQAGMLSALIRKRIVSRENLNSVSDVQLNEILQYACASAAINVERAGCQPPVLAEVEHFLQNKGNV